MTLNILPHFRVGTQLALVKAGLLGGGVLMKLLIAYDGSKCADAALDDLTHAGLPA